jgi:hypothetical protein
MLKQISQLECVIADKIYQFTCSPDSSIEHVKEALFQFLKFVGQIEDNAKAAQEVQKRQNDPKTENCSKDEL